jgi:hypothetical protein
MSGGGGDASPITDDYGDSALNSSERVRAAGAVSNAVHCHRNDGPERIRDRLRQLTYEALAPK